MKTNENLEEEYPYKASDAVAIWKCVINDEDVRVKKERKKWKKNHVPDAVAILNA